MFKKGQAKNHGGQEVRLRANFLMKEKSIMRENELMNDLCIYECECVGWYAPPFNIYLKKNSDFRGCLSML